jgi:hypothetical protein
MEEEKMLHYYLNNILSLFPINESCSRLSDILIEFINTSNFVSFETQIFISTIEDSLLDNDESCVTNYFDGSIENYFVFLNHLMKKKQDVKM